MRAKFLFNSVTEPCSLIRTVAVRVMSYWMQWLKKSHETRHLGNITHVCVCVCVLCTSFRHCTQYGSALGTPPDDLNNSYPMFRMRVWPCICSTLTKGVNNSTCMGGQCCCTYVCTHML